MAICGAKIADLTDHQVTASFGVAQVESGDSVESILRRADKALYTAKESGRNKTCSLTVPDLTSGESHNEPRDIEHNPFEFTDSFFSCTGADIVVYKLRGFVTDHNARLLEVTENRAVIRVGKRGFLSFFGVGQNLLPVQLQIEFANQMEARPGQVRGANRRVEVSVRITPAVWIRDPKVFKERAGQVIKLLRSYFVADPTS